MRRPRFAFLLLTSSLLLTLSSCFTGVENTPRVTVSRSDKGRILRHQKEDVYMDTIKPTPLADWHVGKEFYVTDNRVVLTFLQEGILLSPDSLKLEGKTLRYKGSEHTIHPDGRRTLTLLLGEGSNTFRFDTGLDSLQALQKFNSYDMEMLIDVDAVRRADRLMRGKTYWTRSSMWYDAQDKNLRGRKFVPVTVDSVTIGNLIFPLRVNFHEQAEDSGSSPAHMFMNLKGVGSGSRSFSSLFYLEDLRPNYKNITDANWALIRNGQVAEGMTKEECRLSMGYPVNIDTGTDGSYTYDIWQYDGGRHLRFVDGLLVK